MTRMTPISCHQCYRCCRCCRCYLVYRPHGSTFAMASMNASTFPRSSDPDAPLLIATQASSTLAMQQIFTLTEAPLFNARQGLMKQARLCLCVACANLLRARELSIWESGLRHVAGRTALHPTTYHSGNGQHGLATLIGELRRIDTVHAPCPALTLREYLAHQKPVSEA